MRILLIEDEAGIASLIREGLEEARFRVDVVSDGIEGLELAEQEDYSLIVLDLMLPGIDGWTVCRKLRAQRNQVPILMLTARDAVQDRIKGLEMGADDYLPKPFDFGELLARVRALCRRDKVHKTSTIRIGDLQIDTLNRGVIRGGHAIALTIREYTLLEALATREGQILTREAIQERVWMDMESYSNTVDVHIMQLRKKIDAGHSVKLIQTVHGLGYMLKGSERESMDLKGENR